MTQADRLTISSFDSKRIVSTLITAATLVTFLSNSPSAFAAIIVNDTWQDGTDSDPIPPAYSEYGSVPDADADLESAWFQGGVGTLDPTAAGGPLRGDLTPNGTSSASWTTYFTPEGSEINLANTGDKLRVTWVFTPRNINFTAAGPNPGSNTSQNFRFALVDTVAGSGSMRAVANGSLPAAAYTGYAVLANMGNTLGNSNPFQLRERTLTTAGNLLNTSGDFGGTLGNGATTNNDGFDSGVPYTMVWEATRNGAGLDLDVRITGGTLDNDGEARVVVNDPSANGGSFKFDTFSIRPSGATTTAELFDTSLFRVDFIAVPEPTSAVLTAIVCLALAIARRRK
jgi:hypothetical protein